MAKQSATTYVQLEPGQLSCFANLLHCYYHHYVLLEAYQEEVKWILIISHN